MAGYPVLMCACEPGFTCCKCLDTPLDDRYPEDHDEDRMAVQVWNEEPTHTQEVPG